MNKLGQQIVFRELLDRHELVQVPMIQRDFAQGRESESEVRKEFLGALHRALNLPEDDPELPLNLDFIYGSLDGSWEGGEGTCFLPLDGQQRLTTLFLLHWYLAWKDDCWKEFSGLLCLGDNSRFSYVVRPSSTEFYDALVKFRPQEAPDGLDQVSSMVKDQPWYFRHWRLDPTIQASLRMLDAIHLRFSSCTGLYERITDGGSPAITFQLLDLENFGLSDDLYIKMNARGKPLTAFETFKARYEEELKSQSSGKTKLLGDEPVPVAEFVSLQMDTNWANFFWMYRDRDTNLYDTAFMNFLRVVALVSRDPEGSAYAEDVGLIRNERVQSTYSLFSDRGWIDRDFTEVLILLLEAWCEEGNTFRTVLPDTRFFDELAVFKDAVTGPTSLYFADIVKFAGYVIYMREYADELDSDAFYEWMRIVFNLTTNTTYDRPEEMQRSIAGLCKLAPEARDVLRFFAGSDFAVHGFNRQQIAEEKVKAELVLADLGLVTE